MSSSGFLADGVTAFATGGQANATQIPRSAQYVHVTICATAGDSVILPTNLNVGTQYTVRNDGAALCAVFPPAAGQINALGANIAFGVSPSSQATFVVAPNSALGAGGVQFYTMGGIQNVPGTPAAIAAAVALTPSQSGTTFLISQAGAYTITLPALATAAGCKYRFVVSVAAANTVILDTGAATLLGSGTISRVGAAGLLAANNRQINVLTGAAVIGDWFDMWCDGVKWYAVGYTANAAGALFA